MAKNDEFDDLIVHRRRDGENPGETISGTGATLSFSGNAARDIHDSTDVTLTNGTAGDVTEDVTVDFYEGADNTGTLIASGTQSITIAAAASSTTTFLPDDFGLGAGDYFIEATTTDLTVDGIDENTLGAEFVTEQADEGDLVTTDQSGRERVRFEAMGDGVSFPTLSAGSATVTDAPTDDTDVTRNLELTNHAAAIEDVHGIEVGDSFAAASDLSTHAGLASNVHGIADTDTIAGQSDIDTHAGAVEDVHGIAAGDSVAGLSDIDTHATLASNVHGIADTDTIAGQSDIDAHATATEDVHGIAVGDAVAGLSDITAHSDSVDEVHGIAAGDAVAAQSDVDAKADDPHDNTAHSTNYSAEGHDHANETLLPDSVHYQTLTADPAAPADGALVYHFDDGTNEELRVINAAGEVITLAAFA